MDLISRIPRILATCLGLLGVLAVGGIGGTIVASLAATPPATAQEGPVCEADECERGRWCQDNPGEGTACSMQGRGCKTTACGRT